MNKFKTIFKPLGLAILLQLGLFFHADAQDKKIPPPVFKASFSKTQVNIGDVIELVFKSNAPKDWYMYSTNVVCETGPAKAVFVPNSNASFSLVGDLRSIGDKRGIDEVFNCPIGKFEKEIEFRQKVKIVSINPQISGFIEGQMCSDLIGLCVNIETPDIVFPTLTVAPSSASSTEVATPESTEEKNPQTTELPPTAGGDCDDYQKLIQKLDRLYGVENETEQVQNDEPYTPSNKYKSKGPEDIGNCEPVSFEGSVGGIPHSSLLGFFILAFLSGLAALLTPCVFPMIPMTVAFFMKGSEKGTKSKAIKNGLIFGISIVAIYTIVGSFVGVAFGADAANFIATHWIPNVFFFVVFMVFAAAFFGAFELVLPSWLVNKVDKQADRGGLVGIFFMALTLALVSFSCTGPIVGYVLVESLSGDFTKPVIGMFGFSLAFALPFAMFAMFPRWLNSLPKSGGWLNSVKVTLGFLELALGLKFLSLADQTHHWGILDREVYIALWIVIFTLMGLYLIGKIKFAHDSDFNYLKVPRLTMSVITFAFVIYLIPGMFGAPLKALSGYLPPMATHDFPLLDKLSGKKGLICEEPKYKNDLHLPHNLQGYFDYEQGMACAKKLNKPVFIDFTGHGCVNCREMEARVWSDQRVLQLLQEEFVIIALYVDDKVITLPEEEHYISKSSGRKINMLSKKNADIQSCLFGSNSQPNYIILDHNEQMMNAPMGHDPNVETFVHFLRTGINNYNKSKSRAAEEVSDENTPAPPTIEAIVN